MVVSLPGIAVANEKLRTYMKAEDVGKRGFLFPFAPSWRFTLAETSTHSPSLRRGVLWSDEWVDRRCGAIAVRKVRTRRRMGSAHVAVNSKRVPKLHCPPTFAPAHIFD